MVRLHEVRKWSRHTYLQNRTRARWFIGVQPDLFAHRCRRKRLPVRRRSRNHADDVLVFFVFGKQNRDALFLLDWARSRSVGTVVITDVHDGSILGLATHALFVERGPMVSFHSMAPPLLLSEAIALTVARIRGEETIQNAALLDETRKRYGLE